MRMSRHSSGHRLGLTSWLFLLPSALFLLPIVTSFFLMLRLSLGEQGNELTTWSLAAYGGVTSSIYLRSILITLRISLVSTVITVILAYPIAMTLAHLQSPWLKRGLLIAILLPLLMNVVLQSYGWLVLLSPTGVVNRILLGLGLESRPTLLLYNEPAVALGLIQTALPLAVLPIAGSIAAVPVSLEEAAALLGASRINVLRHIILPLSAPGAVAATLLVFAANTGAFVIPFLLGGRRVSMLALLIRDQMGPLLNWPLGAANSIVLIVIALIILAGYQQVTRRWVRQ